MVILSSGAYQQQQETHLCPYAKAWQDSAERKGTDDSPTDDTPVTPLEHENMSSSSSWWALRQRCPAFESGSCPFKEAKSAAQVRQTLLSVPSSHLDPSSEFFRAVQGLHQHLSSSTTSTEHIEAQVDTASSSSSPFHVPGGCPVQPLLSKVVSGGVGPASITTMMSFTQAMEDFSLAAIMARMAQELDEEEGEDDDDHQGPTGTKQGAVEDEKKEEMPSSNLPDEVSNLLDQKDGSALDLGDKLALLDQPPQQHRVSLSESLKTGTAASHQAAENVHFVRNFIHGQIDRKLYGHLVVNLYHVYATLETLLDQHATAAQFDSCHFPQALSRTAALLEDMDFWHGPTALVALQAPSAQSPATCDYVQRLTDLARTDPLLLLAHAYTRYLGDLSGGRILARVARKALHLQQDGLAFYEFEQIASPKQFKDQYRQALDALPLQADQVDRMVAEANVAFVLNMRLFEELDVLAGVPGAQVRPLAEALSLAAGSRDAGAKQGDDAIGPHDHAGLNLPADAKCPFAALNNSTNTPSSLPISKMPPAKTRTGKCPWPFILAHDPKEGLRDWKTWAVLGLVLCWCWSRLTAPNA